MRSCQIIILLKYKRQSDFLFIQHPFLGAASTAFLWFQRKNKIESVWVGESPETPNTSSHEMNSAILQWRHGWDLIQPGNFILKKIEGKKSKPKPQLQSQLFWTVCSNNISLTSGRSVFGLPVSICHSSHLPEPNLSLGCTLENMGHCGQHWAGGLGSGCISPGAARAWLAPKGCWQQVQGPTETNPLTGSHPSVFPVTRALLCFEHPRRKTHPSSGPSWIGKLRVHWCCTAHSPYERWVSEPNSLYTAKILTWRKASNLILMKTSRAWNPTSSLSGSSQ